MSMTPEEIRALAIECGADEYKAISGRKTHYRLEDYQLAAYTAAVEAKERERCAVVCDEQGAPESFTDKVRSIYEVATIDCGDAIRELK